MRILVFAKQIDGGTGTFVEQLVKLKDISDDLIDLKIISLEKPTFRNMDFDESSISYFSQAQALPYYYLLTLPALGNLMRELFWLQKEIIRYKPEMIIAIDNHCNMLSCINKILVWKNRKTRLLLTIHNNISAVTFARLTIFGRFFFKKLCHLLFLKADAIVCVSKGVALDVKTFFSLRQMPTIIYYGINLRKIQKLSRLAVEKDDEKIMNSSKKKIITIGRFVPQKDYKTLIEAFSLFAEGENNTDLYIIGDGPDKNSMVECIQQNAIEKRVHLLGWKQNVYPYIFASDVFALSSNYEGFPYVLLEAAALGKPILATDTPFGPSELLGDNHYGMIVPMGNADLMGDAISKLSDRQTFLKYQSKILLRSHDFSEDQMLNNYLELINRLRVN